MNEIENITAADEAIETEQLQLPGMPEPTEEILTLEQIVDQIMDALGLTEVTMYQVAKALNLVLQTIDATKGFDDEGAPAAYRVRPQMVYNYALNGMVVKGRKSTEPIEAAQARSFIIKFATKFVK